jgi:L-2-hydroxyglutarate oxidase LhgO
VTNARVDVVIIGGGIVGLATARALLTRRPGLRLAVLEQEPELATHQSGHNSGVVHAGLYYAPSSVKARLCRDGKHLLEAFCRQHEVPLERVGKLVVAITPDELPALAALKERAQANRVEGLEEVGPERIREIEPHAAGVRALWSPSTGIVDFRRVALAYAADVEAAGGSIRTSTRVTDVREVGRGRAIETTAGTVLGLIVIAFV